MTAYKYQLPPEQEVKNEEEVLENVVRNLRYIRAKYQIRSQKDLAELLEISASQLTKILKKSQLPPLYPFLANVVKRFHYTIDEFLFTDIEEAESCRIQPEEAPSAAGYMKFRGGYQIYYFDTSSFRERNRITHGSSLKSGILYIERDPRTLRQIVTGIFDLSRSSADRYIRDARKDGAAPESSILNRMKNATRMTRLYHGELELTARHIYIDLRSEDRKDCIHIICHRPEDDVGLYIGGLGAMITTTRGVNPSPCVQYIGMSKESLDVPEEELAARLLMRYPALRDDSSLDHLTKLTAELFREDRGGYAQELSDEQKSMLIRNGFDTMIQERMERDTGRSVKVSLEDDEEFYHYIKRIAADMRAERR